MLLVKEKNSVFGFHESDVKEVIVLSDITQIPCQPAYVKGVYNYKNTVVAVVSLSALLGENTEEAARIGLVVETQMENLILVVSELMELDNVTMEKSVKNHQEMISGSKLVIKNIYEEEEPVFEIDLEATFENLTV